MLLALLIALVAGIIADYVLGRMGVDEPIKVLLDVIIGILVFVAAGGSF